MCFYNRVCDAIADNSLTEYEEKEAKGLDPSSHKLDGLDVELDILVEMHEVDLSVHESINGTKWEPRDKKRRSAQLSNERKAYYKKKYG